MSIKMEKDMITTSSRVTINKVLRLGPVTTYTADKVSLFIKYNGEQKRFSASNVVNATTTSSGSIEFAMIPLWGDGSYSLYITAESVSDLDTSGVMLDKLATGYIKKITNVSTLVL